MQPGVAGTPAGARNPSEAFAAGRELPFQGGLESVQQWWVWAVFTLAMERVEEQRRLGTSCRGTC